MFNERMDHYGGMSQEIRTRFAEQGFGFEFIGKAKANSILKSSGSSWKRGHIVESKLTLFKMYE